MSDTIFVSAPGKILLFGEHAVVYSKTAIASSVDLRTYAKLVRIPTPDAATTIRLILPDLKLDRQWPVEQLQNAKRAKKISDEYDDDEVKAIVNNVTSATESMAVKAFLHLFYKLEADIASRNSGYNFEFEVQSKIPIGAGMGSSGSYCVCLSALLLGLAGKLTLDVWGSRSNTMQPDAKDLDAINSLAFSAEKIIHGTPSGVDNSVSTYGGAISFTKPHITHLDRFPSFVRFLVVNTRQSRNTAQLVAGVRELKTKFPAIIDPIIDSIHQISLQCIQLFSNYQSPEELCSTMEKLIDVNHHLLCGIGVGHEKLDTVCRVTRRFGLHSKLTGAGGGGCAFTLLPVGISSATLHEVTKALQAEGFEVFEASIGCPGLSFHGTVGAIPADMPSGLFVRKNNSNNSNIDSNNSER
eukprot:GEZU01012297.1.p1 GENE.GEZU01012297.1~~GEZU01012297.1.p1  ORF type:complete len:412 (+),score=85.17 GEZU01012297.1:92-1327(+)